MSRRSLKRTRLQFMKLAIKEAAKSAKRQRNEPDSPAVGVVIAGRDARFLAKGYRSEKTKRVRKRSHAEYVALEKLKSRDLTGTTVYTTLEPCIDVRSREHTDCAVRLVQRGVSEVVIGICDPDLRVCGKGVRYLQDHGVRVRRFPDALANEIYRMNNSFLEAVSLRGKREIPSRWKRRPPVLSFLREFWPDAASIDELVRAFQRRPGIVEIQWPPAADALWRVALRERAKIVERMRLGLPDGEPEWAERDFDHISQNIDFVWKIRTRAGSRVPLIWRSVNAWTTEETSCFKAIVRGFLAVCAVRMLWTLFKWQRAVSPNILFSGTGTKWAEVPWRRQMSIIYQDTFASGKPLWSGRLLQLAGREIDRIVYAPQQAFEERNLSESSPLLYEYILPQVEFWSLDSTRPVWYGVARWGKVWDEAGNEV